MTGCTMPSDPTHPVSQMVLLSFFLSTSHEHPEVRPHTRVDDTNVAGVMHNALYRVGVDKNGRHLFLCCEDDPVCCCIINNA
jgi:hypothetical protein